jgi:hypothetical protein
MTIHLLIAALISIPPLLPPLLAASALIAMSALLTPHEVATRLRVTIATLRTWRWRGTGPKYLRMGSGNPKGRCLYRTEDVAAYEEAHRYGSTSEETAGRRPAA